MNSQLIVSSKRYVRTMVSSNFKPPWAFMWRNTGLQSSGPHYEYKWDWPHKKSGHNFPLPKYDGKNLKLVQKYTNCQPNYYEDATSGEYVHVQEMQPEIIAPDLTNFELKPYVSFRCPESQVTASAITAKKLFEVCYGVKVKKALDEGFYKTNQSIFDETTSTLPVT